ncbi:MAG: hypothetical protein HOV81_09235 [Kofleriaceae bacterium]|nr:hypothetical protein [Kofleriaceae bacterium]
MQETETGPLDVHVDHTGRSDALAVELRKADGRVLGRGCIRDDRAGGCNITVENASGTIYVRVFAPDPRAAGDVMGLQFGFTSYVPDPDGSLPCDLLRVDPRNPACASVIACDPDQPDLSNPACCTSRCSPERGCRGGVSRVDQSGSLRWISLGARDGITRAHRARLFYYDDTVAEDEQGDRWLDVRILRVDGHRTLLAIDHPESAPAGLVEKSEIGFVRLPAGCEQDQTPLRE